MKNKVSRLYRIRLIPMFLLAVFLCTIIAASPVFAADPAAVTTTPTTTPVTTTSSTTDTVASTVTPITKTTITTTTLDSTDIPVSTETTRTALVPVTTLTTATTTTTSHTTTTSTTATTSSTTATSTTVPHGTRIVLDSNFADWVGQKYVTDPVGDARPWWWPDITPLPNDPTGWGGDIIKLSWANNPNDNTCYWMIERVHSQRNVAYIVYFDADNDGNFDEHVDRAVVVYYDPKNHNSKVSVEVRYADNWHLISSSENNDWGESNDEGGGKVEFAASFADLGFATGQTIRMYAVSYALLLDMSKSMATDESIDKNGEDTVELNLDDKDSLFHPTDRVPDKGDIQWSPVPVLGYPLLIVVVVGGVLLIWYFKGRHMWHSA